MPKPTPSEKLESAGWEGEERTGGAPWKQLRALNKSEKRGYGSSTDEEPDPSRAVFPHTAGKTHTVHLEPPDLTLTGGQRGAAVETRKNQLPV
ncbi:TPA: hypothetical protein ACH3X3_010585 [Trebouxia sp. C0006]